MGPCVRKSDFKTSNAEYTFENNGLYETYTDIGRMRFTNDSADFARFKTPTLRNIEFTGPYMHDGRAVTIYDVIKLHNPRDKRGTTSDLTDEQIKDLAEYVESL